MLMYVCMQMFKWDYTFFLTKKLTVTIFSKLLCEILIFEFNKCPTRCDLFSLLYFCRQLYMFRVLTPNIRSSYNCNYSFWNWLTGSTTVLSRCWVGTDLCVLYGTVGWVGTDSCVPYGRYLPYGTHKSVPTQQWEWMVVDPVNQYQKL